MDKNLYQSYQDKLFQSKNRKEFEIWRDIEGYEGLYQVSTLGNVKSLNYRYTEKEGILKPTKDKDGYLLVGLWKNRKEKKFRVHKLVAGVFIPNDNPIEKTEINHKDENPSNNHVDNLEWVTPKENCNYATRNERLSKKLKGKGTKPILQYTLDGEFIKEWESIKQASEELNITHSNIGRCCRGEQKKCGGFIWKYKE